MITRFLEWLSDVLPGGNQEFHFVCDLGHVSYNDNTENRCYLCGSTRVFHEPRRDEWGTRWTIWKYDKKWLPHRIYASDSMWWEWMNRRWHKRPRAWL